MKIKNKRIKPSLLFGPGGVSVSGWTTVGLSSFRAMEQQAEAAVRELIQNGFDAASSAGKSPSRIRFRIEQYKIRNIPGISSYKKAFQGAQESQRKLNNEVSDNAQAIIEDIDDCLKQSECSVLHVLDNGIGLDKKRMGALLADGLSVKDRNASGSYGNGHIVAFPASELRYVLYGGLSTEDQTQAQNFICAGHAILASRQGKKKESLSKDGYFVCDIKNDMLDRFVYAEDDNIPALIRDQLNWIQTEWKTGSVVSIVGFNQFRRDDNNLKNTIFRAAACNFFEAIYSGRLIVEFEDNEGLETLDKSTLERVLRDNRDQKRGSREFLSGRRAYEAFVTLKEGSWETVKTELDEVDIVVKFPAGGSQTRYDLCRNGMWITDRPPGFQNHFGNLQPFTCVIPIFENEKVNRLIREAEGPLHNGLDMSLLSDDKKKQLRGVLSAIREKLKEIVPALDNESFRPTDIFVVNMSESAKSGGRKTNRTGNPFIARRHRTERNKDNDGTENGTTEQIEIISPGPNPRPNPAPNPNKRNPKFNRSGNNIQFQGLVVPTGARTCKASIVSGEKVQEGEIRFVLDESIDITSYGTTYDSYVIIEPDSLTLNNKPAQEKNLRMNDEGDILGVALGALEKDEKYNIEFTYRLPRELQVRDNQPVVLKAEIVRRAHIDTGTSE